MNDNKHFLFLIASTREPGHVGNTEWLARQAAANLPPETIQTWVRLAGAGIPGAKFLHMSLAGVLWGKGGPQDAVKEDGEAMGGVGEFFSPRLNIAIRSPSQEKMYEPL